VTPETLERVTAIFRTLFNDESLVLREDLTARDVPGWDSLNHVNLFMLLEQEFRLRFSNAEISGLKNVGELFALLDRKLAP
jgi:acyl carrier protein